MKKIIGVILIGLTFQCFAFGDWIKMKKTGAENINYTFVKCYYKQELYGDFSISITIKGNQFNCPYSIEYNPVTNEWRKIGF